VMQVAKTQMPDGEEQREPTRVRVQLTLGVA